MPLLPRGTILSSTIYGDTTFQYNDQCNAMFKGDSDIVGLGVCKTIIVI